MRKDKIIDGGPAFPQLGIDSGERDGHGDLIDPIAVAEGGMSRRAYFAAHAPFTFTDAVETWREQQVCDAVGCKPFPTNAQALKFMAQMRFAYADAMLMAEATTHPTDQPRTEN